jgi:hypothetical protein
MRLSDLPSCDLIALEVLDIVGNSGFYAKPPHINAGACSQYIIVLVETYEKPKVKEVQI